MVVVVQWFNCGAVCKHTGVDISFVKSSETLACAALVVLSFPSLTVVHTELQWVRLTAPYVPSFLAFREAAPLVALLERLRVTRPELFPQVRARCWCCSARAARSGRYVGHAHIWVCIFAAPRLCLSMATGCCTLAARASRATSE